MKPAMMKTLDRFFAEKTIQDADRNAFQICNLVDSNPKITISLVFLRDWDSLETDSYNCVVIEEKGAVFTFPCYWVSIPKELAIPYIEFIIDQFYEEEVFNWANSGSSSSGNNSNNNNNNNSLSCPCRNK